MIKKFFVPRRSFGAGLALCALVVLSAVLFFGFGAHEAQAAFPSVAATATSTDATAVTSHTVTLPSGIVSGNLLIVLFDSNSASTVTDPTGWTQFITQASGPYQRRGWYRQADGSEGSTLTVITSVASQSAHNSYRITGAENPATQAPQSALVGIGGAATTIDPPSLTPTGGAKDYLWIAIAFHNSANSGAVNAAPTNYSTLLSATVATLVGLGSAQRQLNASVEDPGTIGISASVGRRAGATIAVHPAEVTVAVTTSRVRIRLGKVKIKIRRLIIRLRQ